MYWLLLFLYKTPNQSINQSINLLMLSVTRLFCPCDQRILVLPFVCHFFPSACHAHRPEVQHQVSRLRDCITVLFVFHRQPIKDQEFVQNIRKWTERLVIEKVLSVWNDTHKCQIWLILWYPYTVMLRMNVRYIMCLFYIHFYIK